MITNPHPERLRIEARVNALRTEIVANERKLSRVDQSIRVRRAALNRLEAQLAMSEVGAARSRHE